MSQHLDFETVRAFLAGELDAPQARKAAGHLLSCCESCLALAQRLWFDRTPHQSDQLSGVEGPQNETVDWRKLAATLASQQASIEAEAADADEAIARILAYPVGQRIMMVRNIESYRTWAVAEQLLERSWDLRFDDVPGLVELAETALAVATGLSEQKCGRAVHDLRARAWSHLGNGHAILHEYLEAERCFAAADRELGSGTNDPLELANSLKLRFGLKIRQQRYEEAAELCKRQVAIYERVGDQHSIGEAKNQFGFVRARQERLPEALELLRESCDLLDPSIDPRFLANSRHNLLALLHDLGELGEALEILRELRQQYEELGDRRSLLQLRYTEGEIAASLGQLMAAERCFLEARNGFVAIGDAVEAAEATLELSLLYLKDGRLAETRRLAEQMLPIFQCKGLHQEALAALLIFRDAAVKERVTTHLASETLKLVQKMQAGA